MNERYLVRGKRKKDGMWIIGDLSHAGVPENSYISTFDGFYYSPFIYEVEAYTIGQSTGLHDKHKELIFEGDILSDGLDLYRVMWLDGAWWIARCRKDGEITKNCGFAVMAMCAMKHFEVIVNIHDTDPMENK